MKVTIFGTGYVGLVTGACLAEVGHQVMCVDIDAGKVERLKQGHIPIYEPGLESIVRENTANGHLHFTTSAAEGAEFGTIQFIAVGTPPDEDGSADLQYVLAVADSIGRHMDDPIRFEVMLLKLRADPADLGATARRVVEVAVLSIDTPTAP